jgi:hypothetical protein
MDDPRLVEFVNDNKYEIKDYTFLEEDDNYINTLSNLEEGTIIIYIDKKMFQVHLDKYVKLHENYDLELISIKKKWELHIFSNKHYIFYKTNNDIKSECSIKLYSNIFKINNLNKKNNYNKIQPLKKMTLKEALKDLLNNDFNIKKPNITK